MGRVANVIVDLSLETLDKTFQYSIPAELADAVHPGVQVVVPFGYRSLTGFVVELTDEPEIDVERIRPVTRICEGTVPIESQLIELAGWMRDNYGSTMNQALKTVLPVHQTVRAVTHKRICLAVTQREAMQELALCESKHASARARLLKNLLQRPMPCYEQDSNQSSGNNQDQVFELDYGIATGQLGISPAVIRSLSEKGIISVKTSTSYRNPIGQPQAKESILKLNEEQRAAADRIISDMDSGLHGTYLLKGVTGSGKTEVYMELIAHVLAMGRQAIVLIPEIALTYQTVMRFYGRFGDRISILNSRMSKGERYDQYLRAKNGDVDIMIGPRSALFAPFSRLGIIIIDEEHESSYKSETSPRYHARETAIKRASMTGACVVLGSATPSVESYSRAIDGEYVLLELAHRVEERPLPECEVIDLRQELREGNRSILSTRLRQLMEEGLSAGQQTMLFLNRRGVSGIVSCRSCGEVVKCPHCDVSLSEHRGGYLLCHYCGYRQPMPSVCPSCGSKYIAGFKAGTQKIEEIVQKAFPSARILRMDYDTTRQKDSYEKILHSFSNHEADILIGTQMIVKGHDFPNVTLMGILAADMSLYANDYRAAERTFQLLTQAAGRAGRGNEPGRVIIQSYSPGHYAIEAASHQDYESFYEHEIAYRRLMSYPPVAHMLVIMATANQHEILESACTVLAQELCTVISGKCRVQIFGPGDANVAKLNDVYRMVIYIKARDYDVLVHLKEHSQKFIRAAEEVFSKVAVQYDFDPMSSF
ncbi:MAG: primosomal protein N' [Clostridiales bacterium]|nr:primosomal protein N' [Clostridiales bacterium]